MSRTKLLQLISKYKSISIIGMDKNVGKTTVLNYIIKGMRGKKVLGITSIGRDGEEIDVVTKTKKPRIYVENGTIFATGRNCFLDSDVTKEILETTGINTPMGEVIIAKALSDGYVELAGPSINADTKKVCNRLRLLGSQIIIVDGAINRRSSACPMITDAAILSTGASVNSDMNKVIRETNFTIKRLSLEKEQNFNIIRIANEIINETSIGIINKDNTFKKINILTSLEGTQKFIEYVDENTKYIVVRGVLSNKFLKGLIKTNNKFKDITILIEDGTKVFCDEDVLDIFYKKGGKLKVINSINIICVTINPFSQHGYEFNRNEFIRKLSDCINIPVIDVIGGK